MKRQISLSSVLKSASAFIGTSMLAAGVLTLSAPAHAASFSCIGSDYNIADNVTGATPGSPGCQIADSADQDFLNTHPLTVNAEQFFGFTDWVFGGKLEDGPTSDPNSLQVAGTGEGQSGNWSVNLPNALSQYSNIMMIFKSGNGTRLVGYLLNATSGTWTSPFEEPPFNFPGNGRGRGKQWKQFPNSNSPGINQNQNNIKLKHSNVSVGVFSFRQFAFTQCC
jgi:hypothetical protein